MAKRYYWLKLKEDFFKQKEIKRLRRIAGGDTYTIIYLKLLLLSLRTEGKVFFEGVGDDFIDELSLEMDEDPENIQVTLSFLQNKGLLEIVSDSEYFMSDIPTMIGSETDAAIRKRRSRARKNQNQLEQKKDNKLRPSDKNVTLSQSSHTEIEIEKDIEKDSTTADAIVFYQNNFGLAGPFESQGIMDWINDMGEEMVLEALKRALKRNKKSWGYAESILKAWHKKNIKTIEQAEAEDVEFQNQRSGYYQKQQKPNEVVPDWFSEQKKKQKLKEQQKQQKQKTPEEIEQEKREFEEMLAEFRNGKG